MNTTNFNFNFDVLILKIWAIFYKYKSFRRRDALEICLTAVGAAESAPHC